MTAYILCSAMVAAGFGTNVDIACDNAAAVIEASREYELDPLVLAALIQVESHWSPRARSSRGACGLTQVLPRFTLPRVSCRTLTRNPDVAIVQGARALRSWINRAGTQGSPSRQLQQGLCGYNAGNTCYTSRRTWRGPGRAYARRVMRLASSLRRAMETIRTLDTSPSSTETGTTLEEWYIMEGCGL